MKQEDKQFLAELAKELNTQDNAATKNPVWCIVDKKTVVVPDDIGGDLLVVTGPEWTMTLENFADWVAEEVPEESMQEVIDAINLCTDTDELRTVLDNYTDEDPDDYCIQEARKEERICMDATGFLTKKSADEHLKQNAHNYTKEARAYALSA